MCLLELLLDLCGVHRCPFGCRDRRRFFNDIEEVIAVETAYIKSWSLWLDFQLLLRTIPAVLSRRGAAWRKRRPV